MTEPEFARVKRELYPSWPARRARTAQLALRDASFPDRPVLDRALNSAAAPCDGSCRAGGARRRPAKSAGR